jgi:hypothetical protein
LQLQKKFALPAKVNKFNEEKMKKFSTFLFEESCPAATTDIHVNLENRQHAIDEYFYGPANPEKPENYWKDAAKRWNIAVETAMTMRCSNCAAFDVSDKMRKCIESGIQGNEDSVDAMASIEKSDLGYCNFLHFKCAGSRSCTAWITGGAIQNKDRTQ